MKRSALAATLATGVALALSGCATTPPAGPASTPPSSAPASAPAPSASPSAPSVGPSATPSTTPSATSLVLSGDGIGGQTFGTAQDVATKVLNGVLGKPSSTFSGQSCELDSGSPYVTTLTYSNLWVEFAAKNSKKSSPRSLAAWGYRVSKPLPKTLTIVDNVPLNLSFTELKAKYPGSKTLDLGLPGTTAVKLPNKLVFFGAKKPEVVQAGELSVCE